jgi:hypothetical protein
LVPTPAQRRVGFKPNAAMKKTSTTLLALLLYGIAYTQGCIPVRNLVGFGQFIKPKYDSLNGEPTKWLLNVGSRFYQAEQLYNGSTPVSQNPEDRGVNRVFIINFSVSRMFENGWSYTVDIPISAAARTTWQEHDSTTRDRHTTRSFGIGDVRITAYKWLFDASMSHRGNLQLGVGIKLPTGDYRYEDYFYKKSGPVSVPVNSTIQLGDGGTGFSLELNGFYNVGRRASLYGNLFYLFNPRDQNGVSNTYGGGAPTAVKNAGATVNSVPDAFTARVGGNFNSRNVSFWGGFRAEGQPVHDVFGESNGQRRAGLIVSAEPGMNYSFKKMTLYAFVPIPVYRTTYQTVPDEKIGRPSPGGFADYSVFLGALFKL